MAAGIPCIVVAPSKLPTVKGRLKTDHRDAVALARLLGAGDLVAIWVPDPVHEAMRDLVRARQAASFDVRKARQRIQSYPLQGDLHGRVFQPLIREPSHVSREPWLSSKVAIAEQGYVNPLDAN